MTGLSKVIDIVFTNIYIANNNNVTRTYKENCKSKHFRTTHFDIDVFYLFVVIADKTDLVIVNDARPVKQSKLLK